ncbi:xanthine dehydrogenase family protein molybdopterin-binding subunit [Flavilitoribacter nigricans]|uniref:Xanthine dehydrogenase n=1 Tax=Flavilitoribacter nigricans (strain ATCC 23147 / DSM 23189 / NBRC 102662 / NCIMB 1420 / SS-2) TaxID=1122177 RepID=A0A2D0NI86_FLAN2|nr:molybdopterin cofactor-binding domain-containing protein [Flavilitoribacter nigricans]PHN08167.1 xanthine dehydrogenase [Flavilitoribacter nigricans DSM 23189 = NBRC 102662]
MSQSETKEKKGFSRRKFLVRSAVGVGVLFGAGYLSRPLWRRSLAGFANSVDAFYSGDTETPPLWFEILADNTITLLSPKVEMGQGTFTSLAQMAADELEVDINQLKVVHAPTSSGNIDGFSTGGSTSVASLWVPLRELAATMREMLKNEAAKMLGTEVSALTLQNGVISGNGKSLTYGEIAKDVESWEIPDVPPLKDRSAYKYIGQPVPRVDLRDKVIGAPIFGMDAQMPDMLYGSVVRPHLIGATFVSADTSAAENMPGVVKVVVEEDFVGVVAESYQQAENAKQAIKVTWETEKNWQLADIEAMVEVGKGDPVTIQKAGSPGSILSEADVITAEYRSPIGAHAQIEPNGAVAFVDSDRATVMISTQVVSITRKEVADRLGLDVEQVDIRPTYLGGGFGRRLHTPNAVQVALLSRAVGKPVKCFFNRKEEFQNDTFRPPTHNVLKARMDENGLIQAMEHNISSGDVMFGSALIPGIAGTLLGADVGAWRGGMIQYGKIPNYQAISWRVKLPFATSWWRSLGLLANTFAIESFMDELAIKAGKDPVQFRLDQIQDDEAGHRLREVIRAAADKAGWRDGVHNGRAMGFAASTDANTPCAHVVEVSVEGDQIKVHKVTCAIDPGLAVNPDQVRAQCEGSIIMGQSAVLYEKMTVEDGELRPVIYGPYRMALMRDAPKEIDVVILENADAPGAVGEPPMGPIGAAIANAVFRLTNKRLREMPLTL